MFPDQALITPVNPSQDGHPRNHCRSQWCNRHYPLPPSQIGCHTVTATRELCASCPVPACLGLATVTQSCGCPTPIPTVYLDFPCSNECEGIWCSTSYDVVTASGTCEGAGGSSAHTTPTATPNGTTSARTSSTSTTSFLSVNAAGRMEVPWARWFI